jgi:flagellin
LGVWVSGTDSFNVKYNTGTAVGNTLASDTYLTIKEGYGTQVDSASVYSPRAWNGSFKYSYDMMEGVSLVDAAINEINTERSKLGAASLRFNYAINNMTNTSTNLSEAKGRIEDADLAKETTQLAKNNILNNIAIATLAQSNVHKGSIMGLLQG